MTSSEHLICVGRIRSSHGVRGLVRIESYMEVPLDLFTYQELLLEDRTALSLTLHGQGPRGSLLVALAGVRNRTEADTFKGKFLFVTRASLPELDPETDEDSEAYYLADLLGLDVRLTSGETVGRITATPDFGGGVLLEVELLEKQQEGVMQKDGQEDEKRSLPDPRNLPSKAKMPDQETTMLIPFTVHHVPTVSIEQGFLVIAHFGPP